MDTKVLGRVWAANPATPNIDPGSKKYNLGWVAEIPIYQMLNFINNRHDVNTLSLAERGFFQWGNDVAYAQGALVWNEADGYVYVSKVSVPSKAKPPHLNLSQWEKSSVQITRQQYDDEVAKWDSHTVNISNPHQLTCALLGTYTKAQIDAKVQVPTNTINSHISNKANPHQVTAAQVGAVPITGGTYTGRVNMTNALTGIGPTANNMTLKGGTNGVFITKGTNAKLGLNASSRAVFIDDAGVESEILSEADYIPLRESVEAAFVPPIPDFSVVMKNDIRILFGTGSPTFTAPAGRGYINKGADAATAAANQPRYTANGMAIDTDLGEYLHYPTYLNISGYSNFSISMSCMFTKPAVNGWILTIPSGAVYTGFYISTTEILFMYSEGGTQRSQRICTDAEWQSNVPMKLGVTFDGVTLVLFLNGTETRRVSSALNLPATGNMQVGGPFNGVYGILQTWARALTPSQMSNT